MSRSALSFAIVAGLACAAPVYAGVGATSAGVTTTDPNAPSTEVQQQSSGFVASNQQTQNAPANGIALPANVVGGTGQGAAGGAANADTNAAHGQGKTSQPPPPPATPPPPPPTYVSNIRPVNRAPEPAPATSTAPAPPVVTALAVKPVQPKPPESAAIAVPKSLPEPKPHPSVPAKSESGIPVAVDPGGGRGAAPDGYTFWFGLLIAGALLALAAVTWLKIQRGEAPG